MPGRAAAGGRCALAPVGGRGPSRSCLVLFCFVFTSSLAFLVVFICIYYLYLFIYGSFGATPEEVMKMHCGLEPLCSGGWESWGSSCRRKDTRET